MENTHIVTMVLISLIVSVVMTLLRRSWRREKIRLQNEIYLLKETIRALRLMLDDEKKIRGRLEKDYDDFK